MVGFMKGLGCGCCSQGGGSHCVGVPCSAHYPNYYCPAAFDVNEFPRTCEFASQSEVCGPWGYRRGLSPLNPCRTDPPISFSSYFETQANFNSAGAVGTVGAQWRSAEQSTFTFTQNSYGIISPWEFDHATAGTSRYGPPSLISGYPSYNMATTFRRTPGASGIVQRHYGGPFYTETEMVAVTASGINAGVGYETRIKIYTPTGIGQTTLSIFDPLQSPFSNLDPQPFVKSFIDIYLNSTIVLQWGSGNTVNVTSTVDYSGRYFYARAVPPAYYVEWQSKSSPETFSGSLTRSFSVALNCGSNTIAGISGTVVHPCYSHGITYESGATAHDRVNGLFPVGFYGLLQTTPLDAVPIRVLRMEATKN